MLERAKEKGVGLGDGGAGTGVLLSFRSFPRPPSLVFFFARSNTFCPLSESLEQASRTLEPPGHHKNYHRKVLLDSFYLMGST